MLDEYLTGYEYARTPRYEYYMEPQQVSPTGESRKLFVGSY